MPYHKLLDALYENAKGKGKTGTTGRGIGPVHADKVSYNGIRIWDFLDPLKFSEKLKVQLSIKNRIIEGLGGKPLSQEKIEELFSELRSKIIPYIKEPYPILKEALKKDQNILMEGAQAVFLDNEWGTYPFVTASTIVAGGITSQAGIPPQKLTEVIGVSKAYTTRVGAGPFPTELNDGVGEALRKAGNEFGTTTGRPRRCGWFDAELVRFAADLNGFSGVALTKLDVLDELDEILICTGYKHGGKNVNYYDGDAYFLSEVKPVYKKMRGWKTSTRGMTEYEQLPKEAKEYVEEIERVTGVPIKFISTGEERSAIIAR
jgi:adenylosuccinate synthase